MQFRQACEELYHELLSEVYQCRRLDLTPSGRIAFCFKISVDYWNKLRLYAKDHGFANEDDEIWFFKTIKPKFTALIEYYTLVYNAELFMPRLRTDDAQAFWKKEADKVKNFYGNHSDFCAYYKSGCTESDHLYFLRCNLNEKKCSAMKVYEMDDDLITSHGHLVTCLLAFDMYEAYILQQARKIV
ncbi:MAG TPA: RteC domain-containing protein [Chitinophagaceae bacterium]